MRIYYSHWSGQIIVPEPNLTTWFLWNLTWDVSLPYIITHKKHFLLELLFSEILILGMSVQSNLFSSPWVVPTGCFKIGFTTGPSRDQSILPNPLPNVIKTNLKSKGTLLFTNFRKKLLNNATLAWSGGILGCGGGAGGVPHTPLLVLGHLAGLDHGVVLENVPVLVLDAPRPLPRPLPLVRLRQVQPRGPGTFFGT